MISSLKEKFKYFAGSNEDKINKRELSRRRLTELFKKIGFVDSKLEYNLNHASPEFCIQLLVFPHQMYFLKLQNKIKVGDKLWLEKFIKLKGLSELLLCIEKLCKKKSNIMNSIRLSRCISCIKAIMNLKYGMNAVLSICVEDSTYVTILGKGIVLHDCFFNFFYSFLKLFLKLACVPRKLLSKNYLNYSLQFARTHLKDIDFV